MAVAGIDPATVHAPERFQTCSDVATEIVQPLNPPDMTCHLLMTIMPPVRIRLTAVHIEKAGFCFYRSW
jgi:hypothetical protein